MSPGGRLSGALGCAQNDLLFGLPVVLDTDSEEIALGDRLLLTYKGQQLAVFTVESKWAPNKPLEAKHCYGTTSIEHPAVQMISMERGKYYMGAPLAWASRTFKPPAPVLGVAGGRALQVELFLGASGLP